MESAPFAAAQSFRALTKTAEARNFKATDSPKRINNQSWKEQAHLIFLDS